MARADLALTLDRHTGKYLSYREHTPGSLLVAPCDLLERPYRDVVPTEVAAQIDWASWHAAKHDRVERFSYTMRGRSRRAYVSVTGDRITMHINALIA